METGDEWVTKYIYLLKMKLKKGNNPILQKWGKHGKNKSSQLRNKKQSNSLST